MTVAAAMVGVGGEVKWGALDNNVSFLRRDGSNYTQSYLHMIELVLGLNRCCSLVELSNIEIVQLATVMVRTEK